MALLPRPVVHYFPFFEGAVLFSTLQFSVLNQNAAIIWCILNEGGIPERAASAFQKKLPLEKDKAAEGFAVTCHILEIGCYDKEIGTIVEQSQGLVLYFRKNDEMIRLINEHGFN